MSGYNFIPIGADRAFSGIFDGNNYTIRNIKIVSNSSTSYWGFFGYNQGSIKNLGLINVNISGYYKTGAYFGSMSGINNGGSISNCYINGFTVSINNSSSLNKYVGGFCGSNSGTITDCFVRDFKLENPLYNYSNTASITYANPKIGKRGSTWDATCSRYTQLWPKRTYISYYDYYTCVAGFVFSNGGTISRCYSINNMNYISLRSKTTTRIAYYPESGGFYDYNRVRDYETVDAARDLKDKPITKYGTDSSVETLDKAIVNPHLNNTTNLVNNGNAHLYPSYNALKNDSRATKSSNDSYGSYLYPYSFCSGSNSSSCYYYANQTISSLGGATSISLSSLKSLNLGSSWAVSPYINGGYPHLRSFYWEDVA